MLLDSDELVGARTPALGVAPISTSLGVLGPYKLLAVTGEGAMSVVYAAEHSKLGRRCAIKRLRPEHLVNREMVQRFLNEARTVAAIQHPNLATVYDVVEEPGEVYLVMELLDGRDLQAALQTGSFTIDRALRVGVEMCDALAPVHARGVVHRDIKPANIFLSIVAGREQVKMLDFGAARLLGGGANVEMRLQQSGTTVGSPTYMSPEQISGDALDGRSDIYAVGVVLYEMLTGKPPFVGDIFSDVLLQHLNARPKPPSSIGVAVSRDVEQIVMRCLEKNPDDRYQTVGELGQQLQRVGAPLGIQGPGSTPSLSSVPGIGVAANRYLLPTLGALLVVSSLAVGLAARRRQEAATPIAAPPTVAPSSPLADPRRAPSPPPEHAASVAPPAQVAAGAAPGLRAVRIESVPAGALAQAEGSLDGCVTPCLLSLPGENVGISFRKTGYLDMLVQVPPGAPACFAQLRQANPDRRRDVANKKQVHDDEKKNIGGSETLNPFGP